MKQLVILILMILPLIGISQRPKRILNTDDAVIKGKLKMNGGEIDSISTDTSFINAGNNEFPTSLAVKKFVKNSKYQVTDINQIAALKTPNNEYIENVTTGTIYLTQGTPIDQYAADGVAVIQLSSGNYAVVQSKEKGYSVVDFGATANDDASDVAAFNKTYGFAKALGGSVSLSTVGDTFNVEGLNWNSINIDGNGSWLKPITSNYQTILTINNSGNINKVNIDARGTNTYNLSSFSLLTVSGEYGNISNCFIYGNSQSLNSSDGIYEYAVSLTSKYGTVTNVIVVESGYSAFSMSPQHGGNTSLINCKSINQHERYLTTSAPRSLMPRAAAIGDDTLHLPFKPEISDVVIFKPEDIGGIEHKYLIEDIRKRSSKTYWVKLNTPLTQTVSLNEWVVGVGGKITIDNCLFSVDSTTVVLDTFLQGGGVIDPINIIVRDIIITGTKFQGWGEWGIGPKLDYFKNAHIDNCTFENTNRLNEGGSQSTTNTMYALNLSNIPQNEQNVIITSSNILGRVSSQATNFKMSNCVFNAHAPYFRQTIDFYTKHSLNTFHNVSFQNTHNFIISNSANDSIYITIDNCEFTATYDSLKRTSEYLGAKIGLLRDVPSNVGYITIINLKKDDKLKTYWAATESNMDKIIHSGSAHAGVNFGRFMSGDIRKFWGNGLPPITGTYQRSDFVYNFNYFKGTAGNIGWICKTSGTPGEWRPVYWDVENPYLGENSIQAAIDSLYQNSSLFVRSQFLQADIEQELGSNKISLNGFTIDDFLTLDGTLGVGIGSDPSSNTMLTVKSRIGGTGGIIARFLDFSGATMLRIKNSGELIITSDIVLDEINNIRIITGSGSPESVLSAGVGSTYHNRTGGAGTSFYIKESGTGNTGWIPK